MRDGKEAMIALLVIVLMLSGVITAVFVFIGKIMTFMLWLFGISMTEFGISPAAEAFVKIFTFLITYVLVGLLFGVTGAFKGKGNAMKIVYLIISTLIGFGLSWLIMKFEENILIIAWSVVGVTTLTAIVFGVFGLVKYKRRKVIVE